VHSCYGGDISVLKCSIVSLGRGLTRFRTGNTPFLATLLCIAWFPSLAPDSDTVAQLAGLLLGRLLGSGTLRDLLASPYWVSVWAGAMAWVLLLTRRAYPPRNVPSVDQRGAVESSAAGSGNRAHQRNGIGDGIGDGENLDNDLDGSDDDDSDEIINEQVGLLEVPSLPPATTGAVTPFASQHRRSWHAPPAAEDARNSADLQHLEEGSPLLESSHQQASSNNIQGSNSRPRTWAQCSRQLLAADGCDHVLAMAVGDVHLRGWWPPPGAVDDTPSGRRAVRKRQRVAESEAVVRGEGASTSESGANDGVATGSAQLGGNSSSSGSSSSDESRRRACRAIVARSQIRDWADFVIEEDLLPTARALAESAGAAASFTANDATRGSTNASDDDGGGNASNATAGAAAWAEGVRDGMREIGSGAQGALSELAVLVRRGAMWTMRRLALWGAMLRRATAGGGGGLRVPRDRESPTGSAPPSPGPVGPLHSSATGGGGAAARQRHHSAVSASGAFSGWNDSSAQGSGGTGQTDDAALAEAIRRSMEETA